MTTNKLTIGTKVKFTGDGYSSADKRIATIAKDIYGDGSWYGIKYAGESLMATAQAKNLKVVK